MPFDINVIFAGRNNTFHICVPKITAEHILDNYFGIHDPDNYVFTYIDKNGVGYPAHKQWIMVAPGTLSIVRRANAPTPATGFTVSIILPGITFPFEAYCAAHTRMSDLLPRVGLDIKNVDVLFKYPSGIFADIKNPDLLFTCGATIKVVAKNRVPTNSTDGGVEAVCHSPPQEVSMNPQEMDRLMQMSEIGASMGMVPKPTEKETFNMSNPIVKQYTLVNGVDVAEASKDTLVSMIRRLEGEKKSLQEVETKSDYIKGQIAKIDQALETVVIALDGEKKAKEAKAAK